MTLESAVEEGSPEWMVTSLRDFRQKLEKRLADFLTTPARLAFAATFILIPLLGYWLALHFDFITLSGNIRYLTVFPIYTLVVLFCVTFTRWFMPKFESAAVALSQVPAFAAVLAVMSGDPRDILYVAFAFAVLIAVGWGAFAAQAKLKLESDRAFLCCFFVVVILLNLLDFVHHGNFSKDSSKFARPMRWLLTMSFPIFTVALNSGPEVRRQFKNFLLFPFAFVYPLPSQLRFWDKTPSAKLTSQGLFDVAISLVYLFALAQFHWPENGEIVEQPVLNFLILGFSSYVWVYLASASQITICVGLGRIIGYQLPSPFDFPLLATSPQDRWRRWNTYFYHFFMVSTFYPVFKRTSSVFLGVMCVFFLSALSHQHPSQIFVYRRLKAAPTDDAFALFIFFFLHALIVYVGLKTAKLWPSMARRSGWWGVGVTTFLMTCIHVLKAAL